MQSLIWFWNVLKKEKVGFYSWSCPPQHLPFPHSNQTLKNSWKILFSLKFIHIYDNVTFIWELFFPSVHLKTCLGPDQFWPHAVLYQGGIKGNAWKSSSFYQFLKFRYTETFFHVVILVLLVKYWNWQQTRHLELKQYIPCSAGWEWVRGQQERKSWNNPS